VAGPTHLELTYLYQSACRVGAVVSPDSHTIQLSESAGQSWYKVIRCLPASDRVWHHSSAGFLSRRGMYVVSPCLLGKNSSTLVKQGNRRLHFARTVHSCHPVPADRQCGLSSTCQRRTKPRT